MPNHLSKAGTARNGALLLRPAASDLIRLGFLALLPAAELLGDIGSLSPERDNRLLHRLANYLEEPTRER